MVRAGLEQAPGDKLASVPIRNLKAKTWALWPRRGNMWATPGVEKAGDEGGSGLEEAGDEKEAACERKKEPKDPKACSNVGKSRAA